VSPTEGTADDGPLTGGVRSHLASVRRRIDAAAERTRRSPGDILLVAVSKTFPADAVRAAADAGQRDFGENRVQEGLDKSDVLRANALTWHLIGPLQTNKAKKAAAAFAWIQTLDRPDLLRKLDAAAHELGVTPRVLVQVNLAREEQKHGTDEAAARDLVRAAIDARALDLRGLMIVPPFPTDPEDSRPWFRRLRELRDRLVSDGVPADRLRELSMGMSHDFEVAIEEGATMVRVGTAIFGRRTPPPPEP
jgi:pyridoxal phosphate enzyme (YggS family)